MNLLQTITFQLPNHDPVFAGQLMDLLAPFGKRGKNSLTLTKSNVAFVPDIVLNFSKMIITPYVEFGLQGRQIKVELTNTTNQHRVSPEEYKPITIDKFVDKAQKLELASLDHVGFNLPWFDGVHPNIAMLRNNLSASCAYYRFPTGENWDFILPASANELRDTNIDLQKTRRPKVEVVSFEKSSTPLIQIDLLARQEFEKIAKTFPHAIADQKLKQVWIYLQNTYGIDVCVVIGEHHDKDWCQFFEGHRYQSDN